MALCSVPQFQNHTPLLSLGICVCRRSFIILEICPCMASAQLLAQVPHSKECTA